MGAHATVDRITLHAFVDPDPDLSYLEQDCFDDDGYGTEWNTVALSAVAELSFRIEGASRSLQGSHVDSGGLWGVDNDSDAAYICSIWGDEVADLRVQLLALGFTIEELNRVPVVVVSTPSAPER